MSFSSEKVSGSDSDWWIIFNCFGENEVRFSKKKLGCAMCEYIHSMTLQLKNRYRRYCCRRLSCNSKLFLTDLRKCCTGSFEVYSVWLGRLKLRRRSSFCFRKRFFTGNFDCCLINFCHGDIRRVGHWLLRISTMVLMKR